MTKPIEQKDANMEDVRPEPPRLVGVPCYSSKERRNMYPAVDFIGERFHSGDHVSVNADGDKNWVAKIDGFFFCETRKMPMFFARWFWAPSDIHAYESTSGHKRKDDVLAGAHPSELIISDNRDSNAVEVIARRAHVLSFPNFRRVRGRVARAPARWRHIYFCRRMYYHKQFNLRTVATVLFPGDPAPVGLLAEYRIVPDDVGRPRDCRHRRQYFINGGPKLDPTADAEQLQEVMGYGVNDDALDPNAVFII